jgi:DNA-binding FadR family transcriptional regulator
MLKKIHHSKLYDQVAHQIEDAIMAGDYGPGDRLPSERELETILGTSRGTIRQSLRKLEQKGMLQIKTGIHGGAFVQEVTPELIAESIPLLIKHNYVTPDHIAGFRESIEGGVIARMAVQNVDESNITELKKMHASLKEIGAQKDINWSDFDSQEQDMHVYLGKITKNPLYAALSAFIMKSMQHIPQHIGRIEVVSKQVIKDWRGIIESLKAKNEQQAIKLIGDHIHKWSEAYKKRN